MRRTTRLLWLRSLLAASQILALALLAAACADDDSGASGGLAPGPSAGVGQGGAQDFGLFRELVERGEVPGPATLDDVGFFNEHRIDLPAPECGESLCIHARLGVMGNMVDGSSCTLLQLGLNTPLRPEDLPRAPLDLVIALDASSSMSDAALDHVQRGLVEMLDGLAADDRVSLVTFDSIARLVVKRAEPQSEALREAIEGLRTGGKTNLYDGLRLAYDTALEETRPGEHDRVILVADGAPNTGIASSARILEMSAAYAQAGVGLTAIGLGTDYDVELMRALSETGSGNFYALESAQAVVEVFGEEVATALYPIAQEVQIRFDVGAGYRLGGIFGTKLASLGERSGWIEIPSLFIASRTGSDDVEQGRRGGGGAILIELLPNNGALAPDPGAVGELTLTWRSPSNPDEVHTQTVPIRSPLAPGETPDGGFFESFAVEKAFVMLNLFVGFRLATTLAAAGDDQAALGVLTALDGGVVGWLEGRGAGDADIADDLEVLRGLVRNLKARGAVEPPEDYRTPVVVWPYD